MLDFTIRNVTNTDWITGVLLLILFLLGFAKIIHKDKFNKTLTLFRNRKYFLNYGKENNKTFNAFSFVMYFIQILVFSLLGFLIVQKLNLSQDLNFLQILFYITLFFIGKVILLKAIGSIFRFHKIQDDVIFLKISYLNIIAIYLIPMVAFLTYGEIFNKQILNISIIYTIILFLYSYLLILMNNKKIINNNFFYFILYICTLEIAPLLLVMKLVFLSN